MTPLQTAFGSSVVVLPVIHLFNEEQAVSEARAAFGAGADGVFVIDHECDNAATRRAALAVHRALRGDGYLRPWVGLNLLGTRSAQEAFEYLQMRGAPGLSGVWCDAPARGYVKPPYRPDVEGVFGALLFSGVEFKVGGDPGGMQVEVPAALAAGTDVLTTSGPGTGMPCRPEKVRRLRALAGPDASVAVASGVTAENARELVEAGADGLLIASGIAQDGDFHRLDPDKLRAVLANARGRR